MATNTITNRENMLLAAKMTNNNEIIDVAEVLNEVNDAIEDAPIITATDMTSHVMARRTGLPTPQWVKVGNGWTSTTGTLNQVREEIGMLKGRFQAPTDMMDIQPNPAKYRMQQERAHIEGMAQEFSNTLFGNVAAGALSPTVAPPEEFAGFQLRYNALSTADSAYVISNGHTADDNTNTSIWFVQWGPGRTYLISPRFLDAGGLKKEDMGKQFVPGDNIAYTDGTANNNMLWAYVTEFSWNVGLAVEDTRSVKRLCNIDPDFTATNTLDYTKMIQIKNNFKSKDTIYMYMNETVFTQFEIAASEKTNVHWSENNPFGRSQLFFGSMPVRREDAILDVEPVIA